MAKPIAITLGDPAGVGLVVLKTVLKPRPKHPWILLAAYGAATQVLTRWAPMPILRNKRIAEATAPVSLLQPGSCPAPADFAFGKFRRPAVIGRALGKSCSQSVFGRRVSAMVTAPIHKEAIHAAGYVDDIGHQEILRASQRQPTRYDVDDTGSKVDPLSTHKSLADAVKFVRRDTVLNKLQLMRHPDALGYAAAHSVSRT